MLRGGPFNPQFNEVGEVKYTEGSEGRFLAEEKRVEPRTIPFGKAGFYFMLLIIGAVAPCLLFAYEKRFATKESRRHRRIARCLKGTFAFTFLIRVQQFGYVYLVLVALQSSLFKPNFYD